MERGVALDKLRESLPDFLRRLETSKWICFAHDPCRANETLVREFYANLMEADLKNPVMTVRGKLVDFGPESINRVYGLADHDPELFRAQDCASGEWLASKLCPGKSVAWGATKKAINAKEFTAEARNWVEVVCNRVSPSTNKYDISVWRA